MPGPKPIKLRKGDKANFKTLQQACEAGQLGLISAVRRSDNANVALVCAVNVVQDEYQFVPLAVMIEDDPYKTFYDPTVLGEADGDEATQGG